MSARGRAIGLALMMLGVGMLLAFDPAGPREGTPLQAYTIAGEAQADAPLLVLPAPADFDMALGYWNGGKVAVLVAHESYFVGPERTPSVPHPESKEHRVFAVSGSSTYQGCGLRLEFDHPATLADRNGDGRMDPSLFDICHHGQWDPLAHGSPLVGQTRDAPLAVLDFELARHDGAWTVEAHSFDGPVGRAA